MIVDDDVSFCKVPSDVTARPLNKQNLPASTWTVHFSDSSHPYLQEL